MWETKAKPSVLMSKLVCNTSFLAASEELENKTRLKTTLTDLKKKRPVFEMGSTFLLLPISSA